MFNVTLHKRWNASVSSNETMNNHKKKKEVKLIILANTSVHHRGNRNCKKAVHTEHVQNDVLFDGLTT